MKFRVYFGIIVWLLSVGVIQSPLFAQSDKNIPLQFDWSQNGTRFAITTREKLTIYDAALNPIASMKFPDDIAYESPHIALSPDGKRIYVGNPADQKILDSTTLEVLVDLNQASVFYFSPEWNREGTAIAFRRGDDQGASIYSAIDGSLLHTFSSPVIWRVGYDCEREGWSPNNRYFAIAAEDSIYLLDAVNGEELNKYQLTGEDLGCLFGVPIVRV